MTTFASSNFSGSASTELSASDANWIKGNGFTANAILDGAGGVYDQYGNPNCYRYNTAPNNADYSVSVVLPQTGSASDYTGGPALRIQTGAQTCYVAFWHGGVQDWRIEKFLAGSTSYIASGATTNPPNTASRTVKLDAAGSTIKLYVDGTQVLSVTDTDISTAGYPGIFPVNPAASGTVSSFIADQAAAATLSSPTPSGTIGTATTASIGASTDQTSGTGYAVVDSAANLSGVTASQIKAGQKASGAAALASGNVSVSASPFSIGVSGLSESTLYSYAIVQNNTNGDSNVVTGTFTTATTLVGGLQARIVRRIGA